MDHNDDCDTSSRANNSSPSSPQSLQSSYNSSFGSNKGQKLINNSASSITSLVPGGVVTTQNISTVIRPKGNNNSLQFVKIQTPELSKKAVEQIRIAEERNISKEKIKEVEEEWQNNLLNWKSKRRQQLTQTFEQAPDDLSETTDISGGRKVKTFAEMIEERAKSGKRLGFHLQRYLGEVGGDANEGRPLDNREVKGFPKEQNNEPKNRVDSDCVAHSSTSSSYNRSPEDKFTPRVAPPPRMESPPRVAPPPRTKSPPRVAPPPRVESPPRVAPPPKFASLPREISPPPKVAPPPSWKAPPRVASPPRMKSPPRVAPPPKFASLPREISPPPRVVPPPASLKMKDIEQHMPKSRCLANLPALETPKNVSSQRKSREDKDRTVLSVSGKKRCSSCKEELGRGAAAFVVESLSLVYHTNCFICSVCHVNLSNGFRGVDVRVHAGALHCHNCYSKDGLNYSRV